MTHEHWSQKGHLNHSYSRGIEMFQRRGYVAFDDQESVFPPAAKTDGYAESIEAMLRDRAPVVRIESWLGQMPARLEGFVDPETRLNDSLPLPEDDEYHPKGEIEVWESQSLIADSKR